MAKQKFSNQFLIDTLKEYAASINRTPTYQEFENDKSVPSATLYKKRFGTWNKALEIADLKINAIRKFSKETIIKEAIDFYQKEKRSPLHYELSYSRVIIQNFWNGWTDFLLDIGLPPNLKYSNVTSKLELVIFLQKLSNQLERIPTTKDVEEAGVGRHLFLTKFGSFKNALIESKIVAEDYYKSMEERVPDSINAIKTFFEENSRPPTVYEYELMANDLNLAHRKALEEVLEKRFTEICMGTLGVANQYKRSKNQLLEDLRILKEKLGRTPMANELVLYGLAEKKQYYRTFGIPYMDLVESLGWELSTPRLNYKTEEELLEDYQKLYDLLERLPFFNDIDNQEWMSSSSTYKKYLGSLPAIWEALDIEVDEDLLGNNYGMGFTCLDKNRGICRSVPEMIITNIFIDLGLEFEKEYLYKNFIPNLKNLYRVDWFLKNYPVTIEYFGLFSEQSLKNDTRTGKYSRKVLEKIRLCDLNNVKLIDLYPEDMNNIEEILLKRLKTNGISFSFNKE
jgi:hypothetical protein